MFEGRRVLGLVPARAGSKGIPGKNIVQLGGKPLIAHTIEAGLSSKYIDDVVVTTDGEAIARIAQEYGADVPFMRPSELAGDNSNTVDAVLHALQTLAKLDRTYEDLVLLQPTQPLRTAREIDEALETYYASGREALASVCEVHDHPLLIRSIGKDGRLDRLLNSSSTCRRQDMPTYYRVNGCIYINEIRSIDVFTSFNDNSIPYIMSRSHSVDIDTPDDLELARLTGNGYVQSLRQ